MRRRPRGGDNVRAGRPETSARPEPSELASPAPSQAARPAHPRDRREADPAQDKAVYTCTCGYVFEADVSTSVGCPNCGESQAW